MRFCLMAGMALGLLATARAAQSVPYEFAIPEFTKTVSLGVYDDSGKLVRRLAERAVIGDFGIGLNGLIGKWDGRNDAGETLAPGVYHVRGFAVGDLEAEGVAYHFNDWIAELGDEAPITRILGMAASPHGGLYVIGGTAAGRRLVFYYQANAGLVWKRELAGTEDAPPVWPLLNPFVFQPDDWLEPLIAADESTVAVWTPGRLTFFSALTGHEMGATEIAGSPHALAFRQGALIAADERRWQIFAPNRMEKPQTEPAPQNFRTLAALGEQWLGADWDGKVWRSDAKGKWNPLPLEGAQRILNLAAATTESFWAVMGVENQRLVGEFSIAGEFLKNLQTGDATLSPVQVTAVAGQPGVYVLARSADQQAIQGIRRSVAGEAPAAWEIFLDKKIWNSADFGLNNGELVASTKVVPDTHFTLRLRDSMTQQRKNVSLEMKAGPSGVSLCHDDGLVLDSIIESPDVRRVALEAGKTLATLRLFVGKPGFVEEFLVKGLTQIAILDVGEVEWRGQ